MLENTREKERQLEGSSIDGRYVLGSKLGEGGMGMVFRARQLSTNRDVALKVMKLDNLEGTAVERFEREIDIISKLSHPNVVGIHDSGVIEGMGLLYVVMELIDGISLSDVLWHKHAEEQYFKCRTREEFALEVIYQLCGALTEPHRLGVIHRDIKPENVLLSPRADETIQVKLLDFGIARIMRRDKKKSNTITDASIPFVGTPHYMSPEQVAGTEYDERADIYALGVVLFEMLSGKYPFDDENLFAILLRKTQYDAPPVREAIFGDVEHPEILDLCDRMLSRDPDKRPSSALDVRHEIEDLRDRYRFPRVRIESLSYLNSPHHSWDEEHVAELDPDERLEPARKVFRNWLLYPSGRPLLRDDEEDKAAEVEEDREREDTVPEGTAALAQEVSEPLEEEEGTQEPVRHTMQAWAVSSGWTDSFDVGRLRRGAEELEAMFEGTIETEKEELDEAVTNIWQPNLEDAPEELRAILSGEVKAPFEDTVEHTLEDGMPSQDRINEILGEEDLNQMVDQPEEPRESAPMLEAYSTSLSAPERESGQFEALSPFGGLDEGSEVIMSSAPSDPFLSEAPLVSGATDISDATEISGLPDDLAALIGQGNDDPPTVETTYDDEDDFADTQIAPLPPELIQMPQIEEAPDLATTQKNPSLPPELDQRDKGPRKVALFDDEEDPPSHQPAFGSVPLQQMLENADDDPSFAPTMLDLGGSRAPRRATAAGPPAGPAAPPASAPINPPAVTINTQPATIDTQPAELTPVATPEPLAVFDAPEPKKGPNVVMLVALIVLAVLAGLIGFMFLQ